MKSHAFLFALAAALLLATSPLRAEDAPAAKALDPFVNDTTYMIARLDPKRIDFKAIEEQAVRVTAEVYAEDSEAERDEAKRAVQKALDETRAWRDAFVATGGGELYLLAYSTSSSDVLLVAPLSEKADGAAILELTQRLHTMGLESRVFAGSVVAGPKRFVASLDTFVKADHKELVQLLAQPQSAAVEAFFALSQPMQTVLEILTPELPAELGGYPMTAITKGVKWAKTSFNPWPAPSCRVDVHCAGAGSASLNKEIAEHLFDLMNRGELGISPEELKSLREALSPTVESDKLSIAVAGEKFDLLVKHLFIPSARQSVVMSRQRHTMDDLREISRGVSMYAWDHNEQMPHRWEDFEAYINDPDTYISKFSDTTLPPDFRLRLNCARRVTAALAKCWSD